MSIRKQEAIIGWGIESDNERDGTLSGFCSCGLVNRLEGSGASETWLL